MRWRLFPHSFRLLASAALLLLAASACGQGQFVFWNPQSRTHVGSLDGPYANSNYWGQMLVGTTADALTPVSVPMRHHSGYVGEAGTVVTVPGIDCFYPAYLQLVAWDGQLWGTDYSAVPLDQLGRTEIRGMTLGCYPYAIYAPLFQQPAVVPVPEPSVVGLAVVGAGLLLWRRRVRVRPPTLDGPLFSK